MAGIRFRRRSEAYNALDNKRGEISHRLHQILPGNNAVIFRITRTGLPTWDDTEIAVQSLATNERKVLVEGGTDGRYVSTGHLVYVRRGTLIAAPFDPKTLALRGGAVNLINDLRQSANRVNSGSDSGSGRFSISDLGSLAYVQGGICSFPNVHWFGWIVRALSSHWLPSPTHTSTLGSRRMESGFWCPRREIAISGHTTSCEALRLA